MVEYEKYYNAEGLVGVAYHGNCGRGWGTWCDDEELARAIIFDKEIIQLILDYKQDQIGEYIRKKYSPENFYTETVSDLNVYFIKPGTPFRIEECDGSETIVEFSHEDFIIA